MSDFALLPALEHWQSIDFLADVHLQASEAQTFDVWARYMRHTPADAVFILGDLFEAWVGDDMEAAGEFETACGQVLDDCPADLAFMRGNRDFLIGAKFLNRHDILDLPDDPCILVFQHQRYLLSHGDLLCIDDVPYQAFRKQVRQPEWQHDFLQRPLSERMQLARLMREQSQAYQQAQNVETWADADNGLARQWLLHADATTLIHGHTHRPAEHALGDNEHEQKLLRMVLSDWHFDARQRRADILRLQALSPPVRLRPEQALLATPANNEQNQQRGNT